MSRLDPAVTPAAQYIVARHTGPIINIVFGFRARWMRPIGAIGSVTACMMLDPNNANVVHFLPWHLPLGMIRSCVLMVTCENTTPWVPARPQFWNLLRHVMVKGCRHADS